MAIRIEVLNSNAVYGRNFTKRDRDANGMIPQKKFVAKCGYGVFKQVLAGGHSTVFRVVPDHSVAAAEAPVTQTMEVPKAIRVEIAPVKRKKTRKRGGR